MGSFNPTRRKGVVTSLSHADRGGGGHNKLCDSFNTGA